MKESEPKPAHPKDDKKEKAVKQETKEPKVETKKTEETTTLQGKTNLRHLTSNHQRNQKLF